MAFVVIFFCVISTTQIKWAVRGELSTWDCSRNMCSCCTEIRRSVSLNSYGMFHPSGPNFLLSCVRAWKKHRPYRSFLNSAWWRKQKTPSETTGLAVFTSPQMKRARFEIHSRGIKKNTKNAVTPTGEGMTDMQWKRKKNTHGPVCWSSQKTSDHRWDPLGRSGRCWSEGPLEPRWSSSPHSGALPRGRLETGN